MTRRDLTIAYREAVLEIAGRRLERARALAAQNALQAEEVEDYELKFLEAEYELELARLDAV